MSESESESGGVGSLQPYANVRRAMQGVSAAGETYSPKDIKGVYGEILPFYEEVLTDPNAKSSTQSQILFDVAAAGLNLASNVDPRTGQQMRGSLASRFAGAASALPQTVSEKIAAFNALKSVPKTAALSAAQGEVQHRRESLDRRNNLLLQGAIQGASAIDAQSFKRTENETVRDHAARLSELDRALRLDLANLTGTQGMAQVQARGKLQTALAELQQEHAVTNRQAAFEDTLTRDNVLNGYELRKLDAGDELQRGRLMLGSRLEEERNRIQREFDEKYKDADIDLRERALDTDAEYKTGMLAVKRAEQDLAASTPEFYTVNAPFTMTVVQNGVPVEKTFNPGDPIALTAAEYKKYAGSLRKYEAPPNEMAGKMYMGLGGAGLTPTIKYLGQKGDEVVDLNTGAILPRGELSNWIQIAPETAYDTFGKFRMSQEAQRITESIADGDVRAVVSSIVPISEGDDPEEYARYRQRMEAEQERLEEMGILLGSSRNGMPIEEAIKKLDLFTQGYGGLGNLVSKFTGGETFGGDVAQANNTLELLASMGSVGLSSTPRLNQKELDTYRDRFAQPGFLGNSEQAARNKLKSLYEGYTFIWRRNHDVIRKPTGYSDSELARAQSGRAIAWEMIQRLKAFSGTVTRTPEQQEAYDGAIRDALGGGQ